MKLIRASIYSQNQRFVNGPYRCRNQSEAGFDATLIKLETDQGVTGWGEMAPLGAFYSAAFAEGARAGLSVLLPGLIGLDPTQIALINRHMDQLLNGHPYVKTPIDMACWDLLGKQSGLSIAELLGGRFTESTRLYRSISQASPESMAQQAVQYQSEGYQHLQVKVGDDPLLDAERLRVIRNNCDPDTLLLADANGAWHTGNALRFVKATQGIEYFLEQPCMTMKECEAIRKQCRQPMILDESIETLSDLEQAIKMGISGVTIKLSRVGGIERARQIRDLAIASRLKICIEDTGGSNIDSAATTHMMISIPEEFQMHSVDFMNWVKEQNATGMPPVSLGKIHAPRAPGLGLEVL
ncbi:MAG: mandelate racemase/muconate lactonizing enzyme family protein, partial [Pseudomonadota bacterium]